MSINRPKNINKRLTGTPNCTPGNAGQIGPVKAPYCIKYYATATVGSRYCGGSCCCAGIFKLTESYCGRSDRCNITPTDFGGNVICRAASVNWIVSPMESEVSRCWYCFNDANIRAQAVTGCTGWFVPTGDPYSGLQQSNPGYACREYWDDYSNTSYWSSCEFQSNRAILLNMNNGWFGETGAFVPGKLCVMCVRAFRCVTY